MWRSFGWDTREVDGHDLGAVRDVLSMAVRASGPACIVASTIKGRGLDEAIEGSNTLSATAPPAYLPEFDLPADMAAAAAVVTKFGLAGHGPLSEPERPRLRRADTIAALTPAPVGSSAVTKQVAGEVATALAGTPAFFASPDAIRNSGLLPWMTKVGSWSWENRSSNVLQLGIAEQDAASLMAGVAAGGGRPVLASMEGFYWRMLDQIRESICFMNLPVVLVGTSGGVGDLLGPMVQSDTCLLALRAMIGLEIFEASDINLAKVLIAEALDQAGPVYVRLPHEAMAVRTSLAELAGLDLSEGFLEARPEPAPDLVILTAGAMVTQALAVAGLAAGQQLSCRVLEVFAPGRFAALPADRKADLMPAGALVVTMHNAPSAVLKALAGDDAIAFGVDGYGHCGTSLADLYRAAGLDAQSVFAAVAPALGKTADARPAG